MTSCSPTPPAVAGAGAVARKNPPSADVSGQGASGIASPVRLADLLGERRELTILHGDAAYTLRLTANNRLILTK